MTRNTFYRFGFAFVALSAIVLLASPDTDARKKARQPEYKLNDKGYYKDLLMDSGIGLTSRKELHAADFLDLTMEVVIGSNKKTEASAEDTLVQRQMFAGTEWDENGILLFPDGAPRFRAIYVNGGNAKIHSGSMGQEGRDAIINFVHAGGSYVGTCAGAFFACHDKLMKGEVTDFTPEYMGLWPGCVQNTNLSKTTTGIYIEKKSPLLNYFQFGGDRYVDSVYHNGGCHGIDSLIPAGGEILARYDVSMCVTKHDFNKTPVIWSIKEKEEWGRVLSCGSHPEKASSGERRELMSAMLLYAMDGNAPAKVKAELTSGESRTMDRFTHDRNPAFTRIGDRQYHHYTIEVPAGANNLEIKLAPIDEENSNFHMSLYANGGIFAFADNSLWKDEAEGFGKTITIAAPKAGKYYISVFCNTTVQTYFDNQYGTRYTGRLDVLDGVPYTITATVE